MKLPLPIISEGDSKNALWNLFLSLTVLALFVTWLGGASSCSSTDPHDQLVHGQIAYPFYNTTSVGRDPSVSDDKFVIRTISGGTEYVVEIPGAAQEYDVEVPVAQFSDGTDAPKVKNAQLTDRELVSSMPKLSSATESERALMDRAYGVGDRGGPKQAPSYTLGINKINQLYQTGKYELALVEINNLLAFFPTSVKLYKMKGTVLIKLRDYTLAERAWHRAGDLDPHDLVIKKGLERLKRRIEASQNLENNTTKINQPASPEQELLNVASATAPVTTKPGSPSNKPAPVNNEPAALPGQ